MTATSPTFGGLRTFTGQNVSYGKNSLNLFAEIHKQWGLLPGIQGLNNLEQTHILPSTETPLESVRREAEVIAADVVGNFAGEEEKKSPDKYCKTMRKTVREISERHDISFKSMVNKLKVEQTNMFQTFVTVADEIFEDGQINWGRIIAVYAFAARLSATFKSKNPEFEEKIALYVGKYIGNKLGHWIVDNGGWDAFADYFADQSVAEDGRLFKGLLLASTIGGISVLASLMR